MCPKTIHKCPKPESQSPKLFQTTVEIIGKYSDHKYIRSLTISLIAVSLVYICYVLTLCCKYGCSPKTTPAAPHKVKDSEPDNTVYHQVRKDYDKELYRNLHKIFFDPSMDAPCDTGRTLRVMEETGKVDQNWNCRRIFYNRVPKCGSRTILSTIKILGQRLNYTLVGYTRPGKNSYYPNDTALTNFVEEYDKMAEPHIFSQHIHFINFTSYGVSQPGYINVIRDPVERFISHYYYHQYGSSNAPKNKSDTMSLDECISKKHHLCEYSNTVLPFFCGHEPWCRGKNVRKSLSEAKRAVSEVYITVGLTEDLSGFMELLEKLLPQFFFSAKSVFDGVEAELQSKFKTAVKPEVSSKTRHIIRDMLSKEYEFYEFVKQRFYNTLGRVQKIMRQEDTISKRDERKIFKELLRET